MKIAFSLVCLLSLSIASPASAEPEDVSVATVRKIESVRTLKNGTVVVRGTFTCGGDCLLGVPSDAAVVILGASKSCDVHAAHALSGGQGFAFIAAFDGNGLTFYDPFKNQFRIPSAKLRACAVQRAP